MTNNSDIVSSVTALDNLKGVTVNKRSILDASIKESCADKIGIINKAFKEAFDNPVSISSLLAIQDVSKLKDRYKTDFDISWNRNFAFVDGGGDKVGEGFESTKIVFGALLYNAEASDITAFRYVLNRGEDFDWLFRASNVAGEELAALFSIYAAQKLGIKQLHIYQDNNLPAKYYSGAFKKIHNDDDYMLQIFINASISYLKAGYDISFIYVPSEHAARSSSAKAKKGRMSYEAQNIERLTFEQAQFFNGVSDILADYRRE